MLKAFFVVFDIFNSLELSFVFLSYLISMLKIACLPYLPMHRPLPWVSESMGSVSAIPKGKNSLRFVGA